MTRKLFLLACMAVAALAFAASPAFASDTDEVVVENPGNYEVVGDNTIAIEVHSGGVETPLLRCNVHWDLTVDATGDGTINAEGISASSTSPGSAGQCSTAEPCTSHATWPVSIEEEEAPSPHEFEVHTTFCLENTGTPASGVPIAVECGEDGCDQVILGGAAEVRGTLDVLGDLGVMHAGS